MATASQASPWRSRLESLISQLQQEAEQYKADLRSSEAVVNPHVNVGITAPRGGNLQGSARSLAR
jgi:hypothetical protein